MKGGHKKPWLHNHTILIHHKQNYLFITLCQIRGCVVFRSEEAFSSVLIEGVFYSRARCIRGNTVMMLWFNYEFCIGIDISL